MTPNRIKDSLSYHTCLCCMCRCGDHKCFEQQASKLPFSMQKELTYDNEDVPKVTGKEERKRQADLYRKSMYRLDYCEAPDIIDHYPLEHSRQPDNVTFHPTFGSPLHDSTYRNDFIPWSYRDQALCRSKLRFPEIRVPDCYAARGGASRYPTQDQYNYYCPPHCCGNEKPEKRENCLLGHERQFNLGPHVRRTCPMPEKSPHPFAKYSNYMLDYRGSKIPPKRKLVKRSDNFDMSQYPMPSETTYKDSFNCPPEISRKKEDQVVDTLTVGDGPMVQETTTMLDFKDPDVRTHQPVRPRRDEYQPPACSMETTTTTGSTYKKWKDLPMQVKPKIPSNDADDTFNQRETDIRRLITTYQEDFNGINSALCPCRVVEKYGPRVLEPHYSYRKSNSLHDMFCFTNDSERNSICLHG